MNSAKPFDIPKRLIWEAFQKVKSNRGSAGIDKESLEDFEGNLKRNLYRIWNRMSSGTWFSPMVKGVEIPKANGGTRLLGVPTVSDRIAQMVVKMTMEPDLDGHFHQDSYGFRPNKSALEAVEIVHKRNWKYDWVIEFDTKGAFDNIDHDLMLKAVRHHTSSSWVLLYIESERPINGALIFLAGKNGAGRIVVRCKAADSRVSHG